MKANRGTLTALLGAVAVLVVVAVVAITWTDDDRPGPDEARLVVRGSVTVTSPGGSSETVTDSTTVDFGDVVVVDEGSATLELASGATYELRSGSVGTEVRVGLPPELLAGDLLLADGFPASVKLDTATVSAQGALKVVAGDEVAAAYAGRTRIAGVGALDEVLGLRQVVLSPTASAEPFEYDGSDGWDRRFLGEAMAFGSRLEALARGYTANLASGGGRTASFYESVLPALRTEREFSGDLLDDDRPPGETLVGAAIAVQGRRGTFRDRWNQIFAFRDAGAAWGIVALDQGVSSAPLLDSIELAIGESPLVGDPRPTTSTSTTTSTTRPGTPTTTSSTTTTSTTTTTVPPGGGPLDPVLDPVQQILDDVLGALGL